MLYCLDESLNKAAEAIWGRYQRKERTLQLQNQADATLLETGKNIISSGVGLVSRWAGVASRREDNNLAKVASWARFDESDSTKDKSVTLVGHTDESRSTLGGKTARSIANELKDKYGSNLKELKEIFLFACEAGTKQERKGKLGTEISESFAQELINELALLGFSDTLIVYSVEPPEGAQSMRVSTTVKGGIRGFFSEGMVKAFAYMNKESEAYDRALAEGRNLDKPPNYDRRIILEPTGQETLEETFRRAATRFTSKGATPEQQNAAARKLESEYLEKVLNNRSPLKQLLLQFFGTPVLTKVLLNRLQNVTERETSVIKESEELKAKIFSVVEGKIAASSGANSNKRKWVDLRNYLNESSSSFDKISTSWNNLKKYKSEFTEVTKGYITNTDKRGKTLNGLTYKETYEKIEKNHEQRAKLATEREGIKKEILETINTYLKAHKEPYKDSVHEAKNKVMTALKDYIESPTSKNWREVETTTTKNIGWDQGYFSKVGQIHEEITSLKIGNNL
jgi:hypothetical protein